jgi:hypothetical protein
LVWVSPLASALLLVVKPSEVSSLVALLSALPQLVVLPLVVLQSAVLLSVVPSSVAPASAQLLD